MSLIHAIFAFGNGREVATFGFVFPECLRFAFALPSLCLRFRRRRKDGDKQKAMWRHSRVTNKSSLTYLLIGFYQASTMSALQKTYCNISTTHLKQARSKAI